MSCSQSAQNEYCNDTKPPDDILVRISDSLNARWRLKCPRALIFLIGNIAPSFRISHPLKNSPRAVPVGHERAIVRHCPPCMAKLYTFTLVFCSVRPVSQSLKVTSENKVRTCPDVVGIVPPLDHRRYAGIFQCSETFTVLISMCGSSRCGQSLFRVGV